MKRKKTKNTVFDKYIKEWEALTTGYDETETAIASASEAHNFQSHCADLQSGGRGDHLLAFRPHSCCWCCHCSLEHGFFAILAARLLLSSLDYSSSLSALLVVPPSPSGPRVLLALVVRLVHNDSLCSSN